MDLEPLSQVAGWFAFALAVLAWLTDKYWPSLQKRREAALSEKIKRDDRLIAPYASQIAGLKADMARMENLHREDMKEVRGALKDCEQNHLASEKRAASLEAELLATRAKVASLESRMTT